MTRWARSAAVLIAAALALAGCTTGDRGPAAPADAALARGPRPVPVASATAAGPAVTLRGAVDLSPATGGVPSSVAAAVAAPGGGAYAVLRADDGRGPVRLATVDAAAALVRTVPAPPMAEVWAAHVLASGEVAVTGQFPGPDRGYGFVAVDPVTGAARRVVTVPFEDGTDLSTGRSVLSADGRTLYELVSILLGRRHLDLLVAVDAASGRFGGGRDLLEEVRRVSSFEIGLHSAWLLPRSAGGVTVAFDAFPDDSLPGDPAPALLSYGADLEPAGPAVLVPTSLDGADGQAAAAAPDGTVYLTVQPREGDRILAVTGGATAAVLDLGGHAYDDAMVVDPAAGWVLLPAADGARAVDLATGGTARLDVGCAFPQPVRTVLPGADPSTALLVGGCPVPAAERPMIWFAGG